MDGLFEILIILAFFALPVLEGIFKKRKRKRGGEDAGVDAPSPVGTTERREGEEPASSVDMIPEEYWEELVHGAPDLDDAPTGQSPETAEAPAPEPGGATSGDAGPREDDGSDPEVARSPGTWISEPASTAEEAPAPDDAASRATPATDEEAEREALRQELAAGAGGARGGRSRLARLERVRTGRSARRGRAASGGTHPLLGDLDVEAVRRAVVWREILGPPVALKGKGSRT